MVIAFRILGGLSLSGGSVTLGMVADMVCDGPAPFIFKPN
jgi:hypothetical protein